VKRAAEILARLLDKGPPGALPFPSLFGGWQEIAGPSLAEHCRAYEVRHRCLLVECDHPGWMQLLLIQKKPILAKIRQRFPQLGIRDLKVRVSQAGGARPASAAPVGPQAGPKPATAAREPAAPASGQATAAPGAAVAPPASAEIQQALAGVGDPGLREKLRLLLQELERRIDTPDRK
jgi:hypothetical protein